MHRDATGTYHISATAGEQVRAFVPLPLPPAPPLEISGPRQLLLERATLAVGRLDSISTLLPDPHLFLYSYVRREALLSSQIEGTQSSLSDLLLFALAEAPGTPLDDVVEVSNYIAALEHGMTRLREGFLLSSRMLREMHAILRGAAATNSRASSGAARTGSAAPAQGMPVLCRRLRTRWSPAWVRWRRFCTTTPTACPCC